MIVSIQLLMNYEVNILMTSIHSQNKNYLYTN